MISTSSPLASATPASTASASSRRLTAPSPPSASMTYDPYLQSPSSSAPSAAKVPEFLRPLPKPARYNGTTTTTVASGDTYSNTVRVNGVRPPPQVVRPKYPAGATPRHEDAGAMNLVHKHRAEYNGHDEYAQRTYNASYPPVSHYYATNNTGAPIVTHQYAPLYFNSMAAAAAAAAVAQRGVSAQFGGQQYIHIPAGALSPPKPGQSVLKDGSTPLKPSLLQQHHNLQQQAAAAAAAQQQGKPNFKVPSGKEGSLKHRILQTRGGEPIPPPPPPSAPLLVGGRSNLTPSSQHGLHPHPHPSLQQQQQQPHLRGKALQGSAHFLRGSLIQLTSGEFKRVEEMRVEDFVSSAERSPDVRLDPATVVRITENSQRPHEATITLNYGRNGAQQVELEMRLEHPLFVYGKGWASLSPERSLITFELPCHRLAVGDTCISLSRRPHPPQPPVLPPHSAASNLPPPPQQQQQQQQQQQRLPLPPSSNPSLNKPPPALQAMPPGLTQAQQAELLRKRRWSAPEHFDSDEEPSGEPAKQRTKDTSTGF